MLRLIGGIVAASAIALAVLGASLAEGQEDAIVARVNGLEIRQFDVDVAAEMYGGQLGDMPDDARLSLLVDALIDGRLAADAAKVAGIDKTAEVRARLGFLETQTLRAAFLDTEVAKRVTDEAVRKVYDNEVAKTPFPDEFRASHILVATEQEARDIIEALKGGTDFAETARAKSLDEASREKGGDLGFVEAGTILPEIESAAAALAPGAFSQEPVASAFGFHVVRLEERRTQPAPSFEEVAPQIRAAMERQAAAAVMAEVKAAATVEKLVPDVAPPAGGADDGHDH
ncbi:MAG: peptidylprolyl isomerase [Rhizobiaceae bacterium]|nr:peptidylprolyl isomerase [Rhizobiaceae bacterium]